MSNARPSPWSGLFGDSAVLIEKLRQQQTQKVRSGKPVLPTQSQKGGDRKKYNLIYIRQLERALRKSARNAECLHKKAAISSSLQHLARGFYKEVIQTLDATLIRKKSGAPRTLSDARLLRGKVEIFEKNLGSQLPNNHEYGLELALLFWDLCQDVRHYILMIEITSNIIPVHDGQPQLSHRPTKKTAAEALTNLVIDFKNFHGAAVWPSGASMYAQLRQLGHDVSERSVRGWLQQLKTGTSGLYVQPKKNRQ